MLIDNIYVVTADQKIANAWMSRIQNNTKTYKAVLKNQHFITHYDERGNPVETPQKYEVFKQKLLPGTGQVSVFTGVTFSFEGRRPKQPITIVPLLQPQTPPRQLVISYRQLASIIGQCLWVYRIRGIQPRLCNNYKRIAPFAYPAAGANWKDSVTIDDTEAIIALFAMCRACVVRGDTIPHPQPLQWDLNNALLLATDASYAKGIAQRGFCYCRSFANGYANEYYWSQGRPDAAAETHIAIEELRAVLEAVQHMKNNGGVPSLIMLAIDSTHARGMIASGIAKSQEANAILDQLYILLGNSRLHMTHVPSAKKSRRRTFPH